MEYCFINLKLDVLSNNLSYPTLKDLKEKFNIMNMKFEGKVRSLSPWSCLAKQIENIAPKHLVNKLNEMGRRYKQL